MNSLTARSSNRAAGRRSIAAACSRTQPHRPREASPSHKPARRACPHDRAREMPRSPGLTGPRRALRSIRSRAHAFAQASSRRFTSSLLRPGTARPTSRMAPSTNTPVGSPLLSRMICPLAGADVSLVTLARRIASELAHPAWPSTRLSQTGRSGATASSTAAVGNAPPGQRLWSQLRPVIQRSPGVASNRSLTRRATSSSDVDAAQVELFLTATQRIHVAVRVDQPRRHERRGPVNHACRRSRVSHDLATEPTAAITPPRTASASAHGSIAVPGPDPLDLEDHRPRARPA